MWVSSHKGIRGNERADQLTNQAAGWPPDNNGKIPATDLTAVFKKSAWENFQKFWDSSAQGKGAHLHQINPELKKEQWFSGRNLSRKTIVTINRIRSGYCGTPSHLYRIQVFEDGGCTCGEDNGDLNHIFWACPDLDDNRKVLTQILMQNGLSPPYSIHNLMTFVTNPKTLSSLMAFMAKSNILL